MKKKEPKDLPQKVAEVKAEEKKEEVIEKPKKIEVVYTKAKLGKRMLAHVIDVGSLAILSVIFFVGFHYGFQASPLYISKERELEQVKEESGLYIKGIEATTYMESNSHKDEYPSYASMKDDLGNRIYTFYQNPTYFSSTVRLDEYNQRRLAAKTTVGDAQVNLFEVIDEQIKEKSGISDETFYNFYKGEFENYAMANLINNTTYLQITQFVFISEASIILIAITISFTGVYLILPLTAFKRGRQTLGMKLNKIGLITVRAVNESAGVYVGRFFFNYFVFIPLNFISFLIPSFVSLGMMFFSKTNSSITSYVFNDYMVDVDLKKIYMNEAEREYAEEELKKFKLENKDLNLK